MNAVVLGATYQGCDLLGELAENMNAGITSEATKGSENAVEKLQAGNELRKSSLRRSLSLVTLSELVTSMTLCNSDISDNNVARCTEDVAQHTSSVSCCSSREQCPVDVDDRQEHSLAVSSADCSFTEIPPLSQRLQLNSLQSDSVSVRGLVAEETGSIVHSRRHNLKHGCLQSCQRTVKSDSAMLRSRRRDALKVRAASILSDDVFLDAAELCDVKTKQHKAWSSQSTEIENITSEDGSGSGANDADVFQFSNLDIKRQENVSENDIVQKFQSSLHIADKNENDESVSTNKNCVCVPCPVTENSDKIIDEDNCVETCAMASSVNRAIDKCTEQFTGPLTWSPRHRGNFCIETSILSTPSADDSDSSECDALQVHELSLCDVQNLNSGSRTSLEPISTGTDQVVSNIDATGMSDSLFDSPVSPEEKSPLSVSNGHCNISVTETGDTYCNEGDYSIIVID